MAGFAAAGDRRSRVVVSHERLPGAGAAEEARARRRAALTALRDLLMEF